MTRSPQYREKLSLHQTNLTRRVVILYYQGMASAMPFTVESLQYGDGVDGGVLLRDPAAPYIRKRTVRLGLAAIGAGGEYPGEREVAIMWNPADAFEGLETAELSVNVLHLHCGT